MTQTSGHRPGTTGLIGWVRSLQTYRSSDRWLGGVVSGIADRLDIDHTLARAVFVVAAFLTVGLAVPFYGLCWLLLPEPDGRIHLQQANAGRWTAGMTGATIFTVIGLINLISVPFERDSWRGMGSLMGLVLIGLFIWLIFSRRDRRALPPGTAPGSALGPHAPAPGSTIPLQNVHLAPSQTDWYSTTTAPSGSGSTAAGPEVGSEAGSEAGWAHPTTAMPGHYDASFHPTHQTDGLMHPARPARRARPSLSGSLQAALVGLALLVGAVVVLLKYLNVLTVPWNITAVAAMATALGVLAVAIMIGALSGRSGGALTAVTAALALTVMASTAGTLIRSGPWESSFTGSAETGYRLSFGTAQIDLTDVQVPQDGELTVPVDLSFSHAEIQVPSDMDVVLSTDESFGTVEIVRSDQSTLPETTDSFGTFDPSDDDGKRVQLVDVPGSTTLHVNADVSFSTLTVRVADPQK